MRNKLAVKSSLIGLIAKVVGIVVSFCVSRYFTLYLGNEIRGLNGVFSNVLGFLQLAELGIGTAIIFALYQPIVDNNIEEIKSIMFLYRKIYRWIFGVILIGGLLLIPAVFYFVGDTTLADTYIVTTYLICLGTAASTYLLAYRRNLLYADQRQHIIVAIDAAVNLMFSMAKIVIIVFSRSFIAVLCLQFAQSLCGNIIIHIYCGRKYVYLKEKSVAVYDKTAQLKTNVRDLFIGRIGGWVYCSTDNLLISKFVGIVTVGVMSNYYVLKTSLNALTTAICAPIQPMIGNYIREEDDKDKLFEVFCTFSYIAFAMALVTAGGFVVLGNNMVSLWIGPEYTVSSGIVVLLGIDLFISVIHEPVLEFISGLGFFKEDRNMSLTGMIINLSVSVILVIPLGVEGVLIGTAVSQVYYWVRRTIILFGGFFGSRWRKYVKMELGYVTISAACIWILLTVINRIPMAAGWGMLALYGVVTLVALLVAALLGRVVKR